jgi:hypothetical protein
MATVVTRRNGRAEVKLVPVISPTNIKPATEEQLRELQARREKRRAEIVAQSNEARRKRGEAEIDQTRRTA